MKVLTGMVVALVVGLSELPAADTAPTKGREQFVTTTRAAVDSLRADLDGFRLSLEYHGGGPTKYSAVHLGVKPLLDKLPDSHVAVQISKEQAAVLVGYLAADGFLYRGTINRQKLLVRPEGPHFSLLVQRKDGDRYFEFLPWANEPYRWHGMLRPALAEQLDSLRAVLRANAAGAVDELTTAAERDSLGNGKKSLGKDG